MKRITVMCCALLCSLLANAETMKINRFKYAGPYQIAAPHMVDKTDVNGKEFDPKSLLQSNLSFDVLTDGTYTHASEIGRAHV